MEVVEVKKVDKTYHGYYLGKEVTKGLNLVKVLDKLGKYIKGQR